MVKKEPSIKEGKQVELILSILLAIAVSYALGTFVTDLNDLAWLTLSIISIAVVILVIYFMLNLKPKGSEWAMLPTLGLGILLPFSFKKMILSFNIETAISGWAWTKIYFFVHLLLFGISLIIWGALEKDKRRRKSLIISGIIWILFMILLAVFSGGILKNG